MSYIVNPMNTNKIIQSKAISTKPFPTNKLIIETIHPTNNVTESMVPKLVKSAFVFFPIKAIIPKIAADPINEYTIELSSKYANNVEKVIPLTIE